MRFIVELPDSNYGPADTDPEVSDRLWLNAFRESVQQTWTDAVVMIDDRPDPMDFVKEIVPCYDNPQAVHVRFVNNRIICSNLGYDKDDGTPHLRI